MTDNPELVHVGWWCWRGDNHGHLATMACRSDNVPIHVPAEWADEMRAVIQRIEDGDDEPDASAEVAPATTPQPVQHAPGKATLCPDCRAKGHSICVAAESAPADTGHDDEAQQPETQEPR
ncbi:hypothetical protein ABZZ74_23550 [Streptomyces sp. NPDC006476]|uniref:hypothetical protein n=1 Tax=Streptomyces sp. NPDC006476 TaxID=3157175 RepID=UPI0033A6EF1E